MQLSTTTRDISIVEKKLKEKEPGNEKCKQNELIYTMNLNCVNADVDVDVDASVHVRVDCFR